MIRSMTGFGEAEREVPAGLLRVEIRTVNHRFFNTRLRTPAGFERLEQAMQGWLKAHVARGHLDVSVSLERAADGEDRRLPELDVARARRYAELLRTLRDELGLEGEPDVATLARFGELFRVPEPDRIDAADHEDALREAVEEAASRVVEMREAEGARLREDMEGRLSGIEEALEVVEARAPERLVRERDRLRSSVRELAGQEDVDEERLAREIAWLADKWDINEEIVRFRSHVALFRETLGADAAEPAGKRLAFVVQEMHREANTIGSKANDAEIARSAVALKEEVERLREQVENVE